MYEVDSKKTNLMCGWCEIWTTTECHTGSVFMEMRPFMFFLLKSPKAPTFNLNLLAVLSVFLLRNLKIILDWI